MRDLRLSLALIVLLLISVGIIFIYSSSGIYALQTLGDSAYFLKRHLMFLAIGSLMMLLVMCMDYRRLRAMAKPLLIISFFLLILVLIPEIGKATYGARRWFKIGPFSFQPSEFAKITMLIYASDYLARKQNKLSRFFEGFLPLIMVLGCITLIILKQPDLGTAVLIASLIFILMFLAGARYFHLFSLVVLVVPALCYLVAKVPYRLARIEAFLNPWKDSQGIGFQLTQSQIALGSGGIFGVGLGKSAQKLFYLPAAHTDFILSIIGEETGLLGTLAVALLVIAFVWQGARLVKRVSNPFGYFLSAGVVILLGLQAVVNIGVSIGTFPTKGLPFPFVSYGGSALIFSMAAVGLLLNVSRIEDIERKNSL